MDCFDWISENSVNVSYVFSTLLSFTDKREQLLDFLFFQSTDFFTRQQEMQRRISDGWEEVQAGSFQGVFFLQLSFQGVTSQTSLKKKKESWKFVKDVNKVDQTEWLQTKRKHCFLFVFLVKMDLLMIENVHVTVDEAVAKKKPLVSQHDCCETVRGNDIWS